jgi:hypothetical protein
MIDITQTLQKTSRGANTAVQKVVSHQPTQCTHHSLTPALHLSPTHPRAAVNDTGVSDRMRLCSFYIDHGGPRDGRGAFFVCIMI